MQEKLSELQGELDMVNARKNLLDTMAQFVNESDTKRANANALKAHIDAIAVSIPAARAPGSRIRAAAAAAAHSAPVEAVSSTSDRIGVWELGANVLRLAKKMRTIDAIDERTADARADFCADPCQAAGATQAVLDAKRCTGRAGGQCQQRRLSKACATSSIPWPGCFSRPRRF